jgi:hypothetical protein
MLEARLLERVVAAEHGTVRVEELVRALPELPWCRLASGLDVGDRRPLVAVQPE